MELPFQDRRTHGERDVWQKLEIDSDPDDIIPTGGFYRPVSL